MKTQIVRKLSVALLVLIGALSFGVTTHAYNQGDIKVISPNGGERAALVNQGQVVADLPVVFSFNNKEKKREDFLFSLINKSGVEISSRGINDLIAGTSTKILIEKWAFPANGEFKIRLCVRDTSICDQSDDYFTISNDTSLVPKVISPNGGEDFAISFNGQSIIPFTSKLSADNRLASHPFTFSFVSKSGVEFGKHGIMIPNGTLDYTIPAGNMPSSNGEYKIKLCVEGTNICDMSDDYFTISDGVKLAPKVISPNGGEKFAVNLNGTSMSITARLYVDKIFSSRPMDLSFVSKSGVEFGKHGIMIPNGTLDYTIPAGNMPSSNGEYKIKLCIEGTTVCDLSDDYFNIADLPASSFQILSPNGHEKLHTSFNNKVIIPITIRLSADKDLFGKSPLSLSFISKDGVESGIQYNIAVPNNTLDYTVPFDFMPTNNGDYKIKLCILNSNFCDQSDNYFSLVNISDEDLRVVSPKGGEKLKVVVDNNKTSGISTKLSIDQTFINQQFVLSFISKLGIESGTHSLMIPSETFDYSIPLEYVPVINGDYKIKLCLKAVNICSMSNDFFSLSYSSDLIKVISPNGGEKLVLNLSVRNATPFITKLGGDSRILSQNLVFSFISRKGEESGTHYMKIYNTVSDYAVPYNNMPTVWGDYKIKLCTYGTAICDLSDDYFTITEPYTCENNDWYGKTWTTGLWSKKDQKYNPDARFLCNIDKTIYRCTTDTDEKSNASYWNTFSTRIQNGASTPAYACNVSSGKWEENNLKVIYPNGGENLGLGVGDRPVSSVTVKLSTNLEFYKNSHTLSFISRSGEESGLVGIMIPNGVLDYNIPINYLPPRIGDYKIKLCVERTSVCDLSDNYFTISNAKNPQDIIKVVSPNGGENLTLNADGSANKSLLIKLSGDPEFLSEKLVFSLISKTGTELLHKEIAGLSSKNSSRDIPIDVTSLPISGEFKVKVCVINSVFCDSSDNYFTISDNENIKKTIKIISPNGGEKLMLSVKGVPSLPFTLKVSGDEMFASQVLRFSLISRTGVEFGVKDFYLKSVEGSVRDLLIESSAVLANGDYKAKLCVRDTNTCDLSDDYFTISDIVNPEDLIKVESPNGGEKIVSNFDGTPTSITIKLYADKSFSSNPMDLSFVTQSGYEIDKHGIMIPNGTLDYTVPVDYMPTNGGEYKIKLCIGGTTVCDLSDNYFTISKMPMSNFSIISPNGGEKLELLKNGVAVLPLKLTVKEPGTGIIMIRSIIQLISESGKVVSTFKDEASKSYTFPTAFVPGKGKYKAKVCANSFNSFINDYGDILCDTSDGYFTIDEITPTQYSCNKGDWYGKELNTGLWSKKDEKYNQDARFLCNTDKTIYRCTTDTDEKSNASYWNTFSTRIQNGASTPIFTCSIGAGKWVVDGGLDSGIKIVSPNGGEKVEIGSDGNPISPVVVEFSTMIQINSLPLTLSFVSRGGLESGTHKLVNYQKSVYTVPNNYIPTVYGDYKVKLCVEGTTTCDLSDNYFSINKSVSSEKIIKIISPNGGDKLAISVSGMPVLPLQIKLSGDSNYLAKKLSISLIDKSGKVRGEKSAGGLPSAVSTRDLSIEGSIAPINGDYKVKVCVDGTTICDTSDNYFTISDDSSFDLKIISPNGGEDLKIGLNGKPVLPVMTKLLADQRLSLRPFDISLVSRSGSEFGVHGIMIPNGSLDYNIAPPPSNGDYKIKLCVESTSFCDQSDNYFKISDFTEYNTNQAITVISPNGGEKLELSSKGKAVLNLPVVLSSSIEYYGKSITVDFSLVSRNGVESGSRKIKYVPGGLPDTKISIESSAITTNGDYKVKLCVEGTSSCDTSDNYFTISNNDSFDSTLIPRIISPNGGEKFEILKNNVAVLPMELLITKNPFTIDYPKISFIDEAGNVVSSHTNTSRGNGYAYNISPESIPSKGKYKIKFCFPTPNLSNTIKAGILPICDTSDGYFTIDEITPTQYSCNKGDWYGKELNTGLWSKKDEKYNQDARFLCNTDKTIYRCTTDTDEKSNASYWNTFSTRIQNGAPTPAYTCSISAGKWVSNQLTNTITNTSVTSITTSRTVTIPTTENNQTTNRTDTGPVNTQNSSVSQVNNVVNTAANTITDNVKANTVTNSSSITGGTSSGSTSVAPTPTRPKAPADTTIKLTEIFCGKGDWVGKNSVIGMWLKKDLKYNFDTRFLCNTDKNIYRCTTDADEAGNTSYWNTFSTRIQNGAPTPNYTCNTSVGSWVNK